MRDNQTPAWGIMGLMQPKGPPQQPKGNRLCNRAIMRFITVIITLLTNRSAKLLAALLSTEPWSSPGPSEYNGPVARSYVIMYLNQVWNVRIEERNIFMERSHLEDLAKLEVLVVRAFLMSKTTRGPWWVTSELSLNMIKDALCNIIICE